jgi:hypothetical protein
MKNNRVIAFLLGFILVLNLNAQKKQERFLTLSFAPSIGFRVLGSYNLPSTYKGNSSQFKDSLNTADRPGQSINFGADYLIKKSAFNAISVGISYTDLTFRRVVNNMRIGYEIHPDVGIIAGVIQAGLLQINYDFHYQNIEIPLLWHHSAEGYSNLRDFDLWYFGGFAPAFMFKDRIHIETQGFTLNGTNTFDVKDKDVVGKSFNLMAHAGFRAQYHMYKKLHGLIQPRVRIPVFPSSGGMQTYWLPQLSLDLGLVYVLPTK